MLCGVKSIHVVFRQSLFFDLLERGYSVRVIAWRTGSGQREVTMAQTMARKVCLKKVGTHRQLDAFSSRSSTHGRTVVVTL